jgi:hypothetical protein
MKNRDLLFLTSLGTLSAWWKPCQFLLTFGIGIPKQHRPRRSHVSLQLLLECLKELLLGKLHDEHARIVFDKYNTDLLWFTRNGHFEKSDKIRQGGVQ